MLRRIHILTVLIFFFLVSGITSLTPVRAEGLGAESAGIGAVLAPIDLSQEDGVAQGEGWHWDGTSRALSLHDCDLWFSGSGFVLPENSSVEVDGQCVIVTGASEDPLSGEQSVAFDANASYQKTSTLDIGPAKGAATASLTLASSWPPGKTQVNSYGSICHMMGATTIHDIAITLTGREAGIFSDANLVFERASLTAGESVLNGYSFDAPRWWLLSTSGWLLVRNSTFAIEMTDGMAALYATDYSPSDLAGQILIQQSKVNITIDDPLPPEGDASSGMLSLRGTNGLLSDGSCIFSDSTVNIEVSSENGAVPHVYAVCSADHTVFDASTVHLNANGGKQAAELLAAKGITMNDDVLRQGTEQATSSGSMISEDASGSGAGGTSIITPPSGDTAVASIAVRDMQANRLSEDEFEVELPSGAALPSRTDIKIELSAPTSTVENLESDDEGRTWTFDVVAENGDVAYYGLTVSFAKGDSEVDEGPGAPGGSVDVDDTPTPNEPNEEPSEETDEAGDGHSPTQPSGVVSASGAHGREQDVESGPGDSGGDGLPATGDTVACPMVIEFILLGVGLIVLPVAIRKVRKIN